MNGQSLGSVQCIGHFPSLCDENPRLARRNLRFAHQTGAIPGAGGFAQFGTPEAGYQALVNQVSLDASRGETLGQYITKYAPPSENDTARYIAQASQALEVDENTPLASLNPDRVAAFQAYKESGATVRR